MTLFKMLSSGIHSAVSCPWRDVAFLPELSGLAEPEDEELAAQRLAGN